MAETNLTVALTAYETSLTNGVATAIRCTFSGWTSNESINAVVTITEGDDLDNIGRAEVEKRGRALLAKYVSATPTTTEDTPADTKEE